MKSYTSYRDSKVAWLGGIPSHWRIIPMKRITIDRCGGAWGIDSDNGELDRICLRVADFDFNNGRFQKRAAYTVRKYTPQQISKLTLKYGDIIIEKSGGGEKTLVGRAVLFDLDLPALFANFMDRIRINNEIISSAYFVYYWRAMYSKGRTKIYIKQTTGIQNLNISSLLANESILIPSKDEQNRIARYLDYNVSRINKLIAIRKKQLTDLNELKKVIITESVTKGLNPDAKLKDSGVKWLGDIPKHWEICKLKWLCTMKAGKNLTSTDINPNEGDYKVFGGNGVRGYYHQYNIDEACLLIGRQGALSGNVHKISGKIWATDHALITRFNSRLTNDYTYYLLISMNLNQYANDTAAQPGLSISKINKLFGVIPPIDEQQEISNYLDEKCTQIDKLIANYERQISLYEELKAVLISDAVTGKIDLRDIIIPE